MIEDEHIEMAGKMLAEIPLGRPVIHPMCRCVMVPIEKAAELPGIDVLEQAAQVVKEYEGKSL